MRSPILKAGMAVVALLFVCSCAQMTRHSNTLVFGTNTTVGVGIGNDATSTPSIEIGFRRQEVALVPLLANTSEITSNSGERLLAPCPLPETTNDQNMERIAKLIDACHFRATVGNSDRDAYSVLASFGTKTTAEQGKGSVSIAQYFATGVAAQQLATSGGANVIRAGNDAGAIARNAALAGAAAQEILSNNEAGAIRDRESISIWLAGASPSDQESDASGVSVREEQLSKYITEQFGSDPGMGLLWIQGASNQQLEDIKEHFEIPTYPDKTRSKLLNEMYGNSVREIEIERNLQDRAVQNVVECTENENNFLQAKSFIETNRDLFHPDEIDTFFSPIEEPIIKDWNQVKLWLDQTSHSEPIDRQNIAKIIIYYLAESPFENAINQICSDQ